MAERSEKPRVGFLKKLAPLVPYIRPYRGRLALGLGCIATTATFGLLSPLVIGRAIDALGSEVSPRTLAAYGFLIVGLTAVQATFQYTQRLVLVTMSRNIERDMLSELFGHLARLDPGFYQRSQVGDLMARATNDLQAVRMLCGPAIMYGANTVFSGTGAVLFMLSFHRGLTLLVLCVLPFVVLATQFFGARIHVLFSAVQEQFAALSTRVQENLAGARVVRAYAQEEAEQERFKQLSREYVDHSRRLIRWQSTFSPVLQTLLGMAVAAVLFYGGRLMLAGELTVGGFVTFNMFLGKLMWPMIAIGWVINITERGTASLVRVREVLETEPAIHDEEPLVHLPAVRGELGFHRLSFAYNGAGPVLEDVELAVEAGQTVAVVGRTGAGKSTLLSLVPRMVDPTPGQLTLDGVDVRRLPLATLRGAIATVPQETFLFSTTLGENIAFGRPEASQHEIRRAADLADLGRDLEGFPDGLDTLVGERGVTLSGGQKQRVALARALLREPQILLLDDCLSAVDTHTEARILENLHTVFPGRTVLFVSHRVSAAQLADQILVLDHGRIRERGTHAELLATGGLYADLHQRQTLEEELAAAV